jgi:hypothetical protein
MLGSPVDQPSNLLRGETLFVRVTGHRSTGRTNYFGPDVDIVLALALQAQTAG